MGIRIGDPSFDKRVHEGIENEFMLNSVSSAQGRFRSRKATASDELGNWEEWRALGEEIRAHTLDNIDYYLQQLSDNVVKRGGHVYFAETAKEANEYIQNIVKKKDAKKNCEVEIDGNRRNWFK